MYLQDYLKTLRLDHLERWEAGAENKITEDEARGRVNTLRELYGLEFEHMVVFYDGAKTEEQPDEEGDERKVTQDQKR